MPQPVAARLCQEIIEFWVQWQHVKRVLFFLERIVGSSSSCKSCSHYVSCERVAQVVGIQHTETLIAQSNLGMLLWLGMDQVYQPRCNVVNGSNGVFSWGAKSPWVSIRTGLILDDLMVHPFKKSPYRDHDRSNRTIQDPIPKW